MRRPRNFREAVGLSYLLSSPAEKALYVRGVANAEKLQLPHFLGIGAQKSGTTWLHENLRQHPGIFLPAEKEVHYFDWYYHYPLSWYASRFNSCGGRVCGEITPNYSPIPSSRIRLIAKLAPNMKIVFLLRNPIDRAWSQALMNLVKHPGRNFNHVSEREFIDHFRAGRSIRRGDYLANLDRWRSFFPDEQFFIGFFESVIQQPRELLTEVFEFLGVDSSIDWSKVPYEQVFFRGTGFPMPDRCREELEHIYRDDIETLYDRFGEPVSTWRVTRATAT